MICFLDSSFVVMLSIGLGLFSLLIIFWIFSIFLFCKLGNFFLIFNTYLPSNARRQRKQCLSIQFFVYFFPMFFLKYLEILLTSLGDLARIGEGRFKIETGLFRSLPFLFFCSHWFEGWIMPSLYIWRRSYYYQQWVHLILTHRETKWNPIQLFLYL